MQEQQKRPVISTATIPTFPVDSSQIAEIGHDPKSNTMAIRFKNRSGTGSLYHYGGVDSTTYLTLRNAPSIGAWFGTHIRDSSRYPYIKIDETKAVN